MLESLIVVFGCDLNYAPHLAAAMMSVLENGAGEDFRFYVIQQDFDARTRAHFATMLAPYRNARLEWVDLEIPRAGEYKLAKHLTLAAYFRIFIPDLLPRSAERAIYLDSDIVVTGSLRELWTVELGDRAIAAVRDPVRTEADLHERYVKLGLPPDAHYFNSGVMVLNLRKWREQRLAERIAAFVVEHPERISWNDQDALNGVLYADYVPLPAQWNFQRRMCHMLPRELSLSVSDYLRLWHGPRIVHFTENVKPWSYRDGHPYAHLYFRYLKATPFHDQVKRHWRLDFGTTLGRALRRIKNRVKVLRLSLLFRQWRDKAPRPSLPGAAAAK